MGTDIAIDIAARISGATTGVAGRVTGAIRDAARQTGAGFDYLLNTALRESNLDPNAKAKTSSATGLFQFIDQTWLGTLKQSGASLGYGKYADAISRTPQGRFVVGDPAMRQEIFALRKDATANAMMAGAFANSNAKVLTDRLGRKPNDGELYMAHFLGASGAARFISAAEARPDAKAADFFPRAAAANTSIFYDRQGAAKSLKQVYAGLISKHDVIGSSSRFAAAKRAVGPDMAVAPAQAAPSIDLVRDVRTFKVAAAGSVPAASATTIAPAAAVQPVRSASATVAPGASVPQVTAFAAEPKIRAPLFQSLFHEDERGAVAPVVRELWGARRVAAVETPADAPAASGTSLNAPLDLFRFLRPTRA